MGKIKKRAPLTKIRSLSGEKLPNGKFTASQQRLLELLVAGIEDEPSVLAGRR